MPDDAQKFIAYQLFDHTPMSLTAAPLEREWMDSAHLRFPYRCLPLNIANQSGWFIGCPCDFELYWYGGVQTTDIELRFGGTVNPAVSSHFGYGVLTFSMPWLFRTPPGINLWVKGPTNRTKDGIQPLEGIVETDWASSTFTMNWKVTRPFEWIRFETGEPICMVVPTPRGLLETMVPTIELITSNPQLQASYTEWSHGRTSFLTGIKDRDPAVLQRGWQKDYFQGKNGDGTFREHQTRIDLEEFTPITPTTPVPPDAA